jgi:sulfite exporter TauE/SafE/copper chaperone CopZ
MQNTVKNQTYTFHITGMHCQACILLTEEELREHPQVVVAHSNLKTRLVVVEGDFGSLGEEKLVEELNLLLAPHGYQLSVEPPEKPSGALADFRLAIPLALLFIGLFVFLQKIGLVNLVSVQEMSYGVAFFIGIIASLSSCLAVVGGLALSVSATFAKQGDTLKPQLLFHAGRLIAFFFLGGMIGALGSHFVLSPAGMFVLSTLTGIIMLLMGLNLLDIFSWTKGAQLVMPKGMAALAYRLKHMNSRFMPFLLGAVTFFLPCGFTQSMQLYTLSTGGFFAGALTMSAFAIGTLPVLALLSFGALGMRSGAHRGIFFKTAGLVVMAFALLTLYGSLVSVGVLPPLFNL